MDANTLRKSVWEEMLFADMRANYFAELVRRYLLLDRALRVAVLMSNSNLVRAQYPPSPPPRSPRK